MYYRSILVCVCVCFSPVPDYVRVTIDTIVAIHKQEPQGDVLAFLTGQVCGPITLSCVLLQYRGYVLMKSL